MTPETMAAIQSRPRFDIELAFITACSHLAVLHEVTVEDEIASRLEFVDDLFPKRQEP